MKDDKQYLWIGTFVICTISLGIFIWLWFNVTNNKIYHSYRAIFNEPVDGININSLIKYNGVEVGKVAKIDLDQKDPHYVSLELAIINGTPITTTTFATIKPQGITGMSYIDLRLEQKKSFDLLLPTVPYPLIKTRPSFLYNLTEQTQKLSSNANEIMLSMNAVLSSNNINNFTKIMSNLSQISTLTVNHEQQIINSLNYLSQTLNHLSLNSVKLDHIMDNVNKVSSNLTISTILLNQTLGTLKNNTLASIDTLVLPNINHSLINLSNSATELNQLLKTLNQQPASLIRGVATPSLGPGE